MIYTIKEILAMPAGIELDTLIAEFMGQQLARPLGENFFTHEMAIDAGDLSYEGQSMGIEWEQIQPYPYSTDISAAWAVLEKLIADGHENIELKYENLFTDNLKKAWYLYIDKGAYWSYDSYSDTAPLAICRAALAVSYSEADKDFQVEI